MDLFLAGIYEYARVERMALGRIYPTLRNLPVHGTRSHHQRRTDFQFLVFGRITADESCQSFAIMSDDNC